MIVKVILRNCNANHGLVEVTGEEFKTGVKEFESNLQRPRNSPGQSVRVGKAMFKQDNIVALMELLENRRE